ncbi:MAG: hypothetical protein J2P37_13175 [Ktedonobacteraceae bacterium]|nr:hypothetical protein [Ktedonobacteraceae bacterium]MBO0790992.1 hypothetical protein [Ktedonobacteraceae bacterium]
MGNPEISEGPRSGEVPPVDVDARRFGFEHGQVLPTAHSDAVSRDPEDQRRTVSEMYRQLAPDVQRQVNQGDPMVRLLSSEILDIRGVTPDLDKVPRFLENPHPLQKFVADMFNAPAAPPIPERPAGVLPVRLPDASLGWVTPGTRELRNYGHMMQVKGDACTVIAMQETMRRYIDPEKRNPDLNEHPLLEEARSLGIYRPPIIGEDGEPVIGEDGRTMTHKLALFSKSPEFMGGHGVPAQYIGMGCSEAHLDAVKTRAAEVMAWMIESGYSELWRTDLKYLQLGERTSGNGHSLTTIGAVREFVEDNPRNNPLKGLILNENWTGGPDEENWQTGWRDPSYRTMVTGVLAPARDTIDMHGNHLSGVVDSMFFPVPDPIRIPGQLDYACRMVFTERPIPRFAENHPFTRPS